MRWGQRQRQSRQQQQRVPRCRRRELELGRCGWAGVAAKSSTSDPMAMQTGQGKHAGQAQAMCGRWNVYREGEGREDSDGSASTGAYDVGRGR